MQLLRIPQKFRSYNRDAVHVGRSSVSNVLSAILLSISALFNVTDEYFLSDTYCFVTSVCRLDLCVASICQIKSAC